MVTPQNRNDIAPCSPWPALARGASSPLWLAAECVVGGSRASELDCSSVRRGRRARTRSYDFLGRSTRITQSGQSGGNAVAEKRVDFGYDSHFIYQFDTITRYADLAAALTVAVTDYDYDRAGRLNDLAHRDGDTSQLTGVDRAGSNNDEAYTFDENGNRIGGGYTVGSNNRLLSDGTYNYGYDAEGNRISKTTIATGEAVLYSWDHRNRLTAIATKNSLGVVTHEVQYTYDVFNRRIVKIIDADGAGAAPATSEIYIFDGLRSERDNAGDHILLVFDGDGELTSRHLHGPQVDQILSSEAVDNLFAAGDMLWALTDHLGSVRDLVEYDAVTDESNVVNHIVYDGFGQVTGETDPAIGFLFGFTGRERDAESDLQYNRARYYDAALGRWLSQDPIGFEAGDGNLYRYTRNATSSQVDPSGLESRAYWQARARLSAGIVPGLSAEELNQRITAAYAQMFLRDVERHLWAGMAALASELVGQGIYRARCLEEAYSRNPFAGITVAFSFDPSELRRALEVGNRAVFNDIYWQFLAFSDKGIDEMRELNRRGELPLELLAAWEAINNGETERGNEMLLRYEQERTLQGNVYNVFPRILFRFTHTVESPIPGDRTSAREGGCYNLADFDQRWEWIETSMLPAYLSLYNTNLNLLKSILQGHIDRVPPIR